MLVDRITRLAEPFNLHFLEAEPGKLDIKRCDKLVHSSN